MGGGKWDSTQYRTYSSTTQRERPHIDQLFTQRMIDPTLDPKNINRRESRDSAANPNSNAIIVALDVTGSMGRVIDVMARQGLGTLIEQIYERKPVTDPHVMLMGIGDIDYDRAPLQVTQFEAEVKPLTEQIEKIWLERGGGGNGWESYALPHLFAGLFTDIDCWEKRGRKGYLFTVGDEEATPFLVAEQVATKVFGKPVPGNLPRATGEDILRLASEKYHVFHVIVEEGDYARAHPDRVRSSWTNLLGQRVIPLADHRKLAEVVVSAIQVDQGADRDTVVKSWGGETSLVVASALK